MRKEKPRAKEVSTNPEEDFDTATEAKYRRWQEREDKNTLAAECIRLGLTSRATPHRNETGAPLRSRGCTSNALDIEKKTRCDGLDAFCQREAIVAPDENFIYPARHRVGALTAEMPEVDEEIAASEGTFQARIALGKLRETLKQVEEAAAKATWTRDDLAKQIAIVTERHAEQERECSGGGAATIRASFSTSADLLHAGVAAGSNPTISARRLARAWRLFRAGRPSPAFSRRSRKPPCRSAGAGRQGDGGLARGLRPHRRPAPAFLKGR